LRDRLLGGPFSILAALAVSVSAQAQPSNIRYWRITEMIPEPWTDAAAVTSGPPELPGLSAASVWITLSISRPERVRSERPRALTTPAVTVH